jgi:uncharacterized membrane protein
MLLFFATIGASSGSLASLVSSGPLLLFIAIMTGVHWLVLGVGGKLLGLPPRMLVLGSNANIGGPATAAGEQRVTGEFGIGSFGVLLQLRWFCRACPAFGGGVSSMPVCNRV